MTRTPIDLKPLQTLYEQSPCARAAFEYFAGREYRSTETRVETLQQALRGTGAFSRAEVIELFKELDHSSCGQFIVGRKGHPSRFVWEVDLVSVGQAVTGEGTDVELLAEDERDDMAEGGALGILEHRFHLRPGFEVALELPANLTKLEADRLAKFVQALPFEASE